MTARGTTISTGYASTEFYVESCFKCGCLFAMTVEFKNARKQDRDTFYCPAGHGQRYTGKTDAERLKEQQAEAERLAGEVEFLKRSNASLRGHVTRRENAVAS